MPSFCKIDIMGNLTRSPEIRYSPTGTPIATFGLACSRKFKQGDELKEEVCFVDVVMFGKQAETVVQYLDKGDCVLFSGRLQQRRWESEDGKKHSKHEVVADHVTFIKTKKIQGQQEGGHAEQHPYE